MSRKILSTCSKAFRKEYITRLKVRKSNKQFFLASILQKANKFVFIISALASKMGQKNQQIIISIRGYLLPLFFI